LTKKGPNRQAFVTKSLNRWQPCLALKHVTPRWRWKPKKKCTLQ